MMMVPAKQHFKALIALAERRFRKTQWYSLPVVLFLLCCSLNGFSQEVSVQLKADSTHITIGDYLNVKLEITFTDDLSIVMPLVKDSIGNMELIKTSPVDTNIKGNSKTFSQVYTVSAYDSGMFHAGPEKILYKTGEGRLDSLFTDSILIAVSTLPVDTSKAFKEIKAPVEVPYSLSEFIPLIAGILILLAIIAGIIFYIRQRRKNKKPKPIVRPKPKDPPHVWAKNELKKLEDEKLWQKDEIKNYYSRLTDILRLYLEYRFGWFALESTTEKIEEDIVGYGLAPEAKENLLRILKEGDLVKFAKMIPMPDANVRVMELAYGFVEATVPKETPTAEKIETS